LEWILLYYFISDRINEIIRVKSTFGGKKNFRIANISLFNFCTGNCVYLIANISHLAAGDWVFFVSSGNKE
jgi:hypothetical protein